MKRLSTLFGIVLCILLLGNSSSFAQISVSVTGYANTTPNLASSYTSLANAITALNAVTAMSGPVVFNLAAGGTESTTAQLTINTIPGVSTTNTITFQKSGAGTNPKVTRTDAGTNTTSTFGGLGDAIIRLDGTDYITINGLDVAASQSTIEYGYFTYKPSATNGCQYVTIQNCVITMTKSTSAYVTGIYISNGPTTVSSSTGVTVSATTGRNEYVTITGNTIQNVHAGLHIRGYNHSTSPYNFQDQNVTVGSSGAGNIIQNFGGGSATTTYGVYLIYQANPTVSYNTINNAGGGGSNHGSTLYGIFMSTSNAAGDCIYNNNNITLGESSTSGAHCIYDLQAGTTKTINNNTISYGTFASTTASYAIYASSTTPTVTVSGNSISGTINKSGTSGNFYFYANSGSPTAAGTETITNNTISNVILTGSSGFYGIYSNTATAVNRICYGNTVSNITSGSGTTYLLEALSATNNQVYNNTVTNCTGSGSMYTLYFSGTNPTVYGNSVNNVSTSGASTVYGIYNAGSGTTNCYRNNVYNLYGTNASSVVYGMYISTGTQNNTFNNFISDLRVPTGSASIPIAGIWINGGTAVNLYYNTVFLNSTSSGTTFGVRGIYASTTPTLDMRNNIVVTTSTPNGSGLNVAYMRNSSTLTTYSTTSNNNCFYAGSPSTSNLLYYDGTNSIQTISAYKTLMSTRDAASFSEIPPFTNISSTPYNLHISSGTPTQCESGGTRVTSPIAITDDYDANTRYGETGYSGTGTAPDVGADEGEFTPAQNMTYVSSTTTQISGYTFAGSVNQSIIRIEVVTSGATNSISVTQLGLNANGTTNIADINASTAKIYYTGTSSTFGTGTLFGSTTPTIANFTVTGTQVLSEGTNYFWLAYDITPGASTGNFVDGECSTITVGGSSQTPTVTAPSGYKTIVGPMSGNYYVGQGYSFPNFATISDAFTHLNNRGISGAVTFILTNSSSTPYNAANGETFPLSLGVISGASSTNTITMKPNTGVSPVITGASANAVIWLNGTDYFTLDGSNSGGTDKSLTVENITTSASTASVWLSGASAGNGATNNTIKNCNLKTGINSTNATYGIYIGGTTIGNVGYDNDNNTIQNNYIYKAYYGIYSNGSTTATSDNLNITGNTIGAPVGTTTDYIWNIGMYLLQSPNATITQNTIQNIITTATTPKGIYLYTGCINSTISRNKVNNIQYISTGGYGGWGIYVNTGNTASNLAINNNLVYIMGGDGYTSMSNSSPVGMYIDGSTGGMNIYHNSVYMSGNLTYSGATLTSAIYFGSSTIVSVDLRNNIFQNSMVNTVNTSAKNYAIYSTPANTAFTQINYNDYYVTGTQGVLGYLGADQGTLALWQTATGKDGNSMYTDPLFNSTSDLRPALTSPVIGTGTPVGITIDFDGNPRSGSNPSIGGYEAGADGSAPIITYTTLTNTSSTANRTLDNVSITDLGYGVNWTTAPRIYYKKSTDNNVFGGNTSADNGWKWMPANVGSTPTNFTIDYSIIYGGSVTGDDFIQYFVVAQDLNSTPNVSANPSTGFAGTSVSSITSAPTTPNQYKIVGSPLSGDYTVGVLVFNKAYNRNIVLEKRTRVVKQEVAYEEVVSDAKVTQTKTKNNSDNVVNKKNPKQISDVSDEIQPPAVKTITKTKTVEAIEEYSVLMENGKEFKEDLSNLDVFSKGVFPTITVAVAAAVERGVAGPVRFLLTDATYTGETFPIVITEIVGSSATNTITIKPNIGVTSAISASSPTTAMFRLNGADNIIFDGSNTTGGTTRNMSLQNNSTSVPIFLLENGATNNVIKNCRLESANSTTTSGAIAILSTTTVGNSYNTINNNLILDRSGSGTPYNSIYSSGLTTAMNMNNTITGNEITNFSNNGIYITATGNGSNWIISGNHFYNSLTPSVAQTSINFVPGAPSKSNTINGNVIGGSAYNAGGTAWTNSGAIAFTGIVISVDSVDGSAVTNNIIKNISLSSTGASTFNGINVTLGFVNVTGNTVGDESTSNSILVAGSSTTHGIQILHATGTYNMISILTRQNVKDNLIANLSATGTGTSVRVRGVHFASYSRLNISRNNIHHLYTTSTGSGLTGNSQAVVGINGWQQTYLGVIIDSNTIHTLTAASTGSYATSACGIFTSNFDGTISRNRIYNIVNNSTMATLTTPPIAAGIYMRWDGDNNSINNNMISLGSGLSDNVQFDGIIQVANPNTYPLNIYYNTISISGTATSGTHRCYSFVIGDNTGTTAIATVPMIRNNIFDNQRTGGTGSYYAIGYQVLSTGWAANSSNYNCLNSSSASTVGYWNNADQTFAAWQTSSSGDGNSYTGQTVNYVSATTGNLHINMGTTSSILESNGTPISGLTVDIDNDVRPGPVGSVNGGALAPDFGADEWDGVPGDLAAPIMAYTPLSSTSSTSNRVLNSTITDFTGVPTSGSLVPRIYYKKGTGGTWYSQPGTLISGNGKNGSWNFTINNADMGGVTGADVIYYYLIGQDNCTPINIGSNPLGAVASDVNTVTTPPTTPNSYTILNTLSPGTYAIGPTAPYAGYDGSFYTMTETVNLVNVAELSGDVIFEFQADYDGTSVETFPINFGNITSVGGSWNVIYRPAPDVPSTIAIAGDPGSGNALITFNGSDRVIIDGRPGGSGDNHLTISNSRTAATVGETILMLNDATSITLEYLTIEGDNSTTTGGVVSIKGTTGSTGNDDNLITHCDIKNYTGAYPNIGLWIDGQNNTSLTNDNITVSNCNIYNFGDNIASTNPRGIYISRCNNAIITENSFYRTTALTAQGLAQLIIIGASGSGNGHTITNNYFGGSAPLGVGTFVITTSTSGAYVIDIYDVSLQTTSTTVSGNYIKGWDLTSSSDPTSTTVLFCGVFHRSTAGNVTITGNTIGDNTVNATTTPSIKFTTTGVNTTYYAALEGIDVRAGTGTISNNIIGGVRMLQTGARNCTFTGIYHGTAGTPNINNNIVGATNSVLIDKPLARPNENANVNKQISNSENISDNSKRNSDNQITEKNRIVETDISFNKVNTASTVTYTEPVHVTPQQKADGNSKYAKTNTNENVQDAIVKSNVTTDKTSKSTNEGTPDALTAPVKEKETQTDNAIIPNISMETAGPVTGISSGWAGSITNNLVANISMNPTTTSTTTQLFTGINITNTSVTTANNIVTGNTVRNIFNNATGGTSSGITTYTTSTGTLTCNNNTISTITFTSPSSGTATFAGIILQSSGNFTVTGNTISTIVSNSNSTSSGSSHNVFTGIYNVSTSASTSNLIGSNIIKDITGNPLTASTSIKLQGVFNNASTSSGQVSKNKIYNFLTNSTSNSTIICGYFSFYGAIWTYDNNAIDLGEGVSSDILVYGVYDYSDNNTGYWYYNTIRISGTVTSGLTATAAYFRNSTTSNVTEMQNNNFINLRTGGTGSHLVLNNAVGASGWSLSNYNNLYSSNAATIGRWGTSTDLNLDTWKTNSIMDKYSVSGNIVFDGTTILKPLLSDPSCWILNGKGTPVTGFNSDLGAVSRSVSISAGATDIGAYEFLPTSNPNDALYNPATIIDGATTNFTVAGNIVASITWHTGTGTLPTAMSVKYRSGENPPSPISGANFGNLNTVVNPTGGSTGYTYDFVYYYTPALLGTINGETNTRLAKYDASTWDQFDATPNTTNKTVTVTGLTTFSNFTFADENAPLPVQIKSFSSNVIGRNVKLTWITEKENNNKGFEIQRSIHNDNNFVNVGYMNSKGNANSPSNYSFEDKKLNTGKYDYRLKQIDLNGHFTFINLSNIVEVALPKNFSLSQNYPNPFNPATKIDFELPFDSRVRIVIYDMLGREVKILVNSENKQAGFYTVDLNAANLASGTYFYRMIANSQGKDNIFTKKMTIVK